MQEPSKLFRLSLERAVRNGRAGYDVERCLLKEEGYQLSNPQDLPFIMFLGFAAAELSI